MTLLMHGGLHWTKCRSWLSTTTRYSARQNRHCVSRFISSPLALSCCPKSLPSRSCRNLYEAILDVRFDRRNFYNKMKRLGMLEQMDETVNPSQKKEAFLFRFNKAKYDELKQKGFRLEF